MTNEYNPDGKEIRFIDSHYKDLFHIPDGSCVQIHYPDEMVVKPCRMFISLHPRRRSSESMRRWTSLASAAWEPICGKWLWMVTVSDWICRM